MIRMDIVDTGMQQEATMNPGRAKALDPEIQDALDDEKCCAGGFCRDCSCNMTRRGIIKLTIAAASFSALVALMIVLIVIYAGIR